MSCLFIFMGYDFVVLNVLKLWNNVMFVKIYGYYLFFDIRLRVNLVFEI